MTIDFSDLCKLIANAYGLPEDFWKTDLLSISLTRRPFSFGMSKSNPTYHIGQPRSGAVEIILDLDEADELLSIEFH